MTSFGGLSVQAENDETLQNIAFTLAVGENGGAGAAVNVNVLNNTTNAFLDSNVQANVADLTQVTAESSLESVDGPHPQFDGRPDHPQPTNNHHRHTDARIECRSSGFSSSAPLSVGEPSSAAPASGLGRSSGDRRCTLHRHTDANANQITTDTITGLAVGETVSGTDIQPGTTIQSIVYTPSGTVLTLSVARDGHRPPVPATDR